MAKKAQFEVECPCCGATLKIDSEVRAVISHKEKPAPKTLEDISAGVARLKGAQAQREEAFQKSFEAMKSSKDVLSRKFDELLKQAKEDDPSKPPPKPLGLE
jgi:predicted nucleotide-binding protein (sugar kinase/HSP70/actin superfamily)